GRRDVLTAAADHLLDPAAEVEAAVLADADVTGLQPAIRGEGIRGLGPEIAQRTGGVAELDLALLTLGQRATVLADDPDPVRAGVGIPYPAWGQILTGLRERAERALGQPIKRDQIGGRD